jgi:hypothetical protein
VTRRLVYEIRVAGCLGREWQEWFDGVALHHETGQDGQAPTTVLRGALDQAALHGILMRIGDLGLCLLSLQGTWAPPKGKSFACS